MITTLFCTWYMIEATHTLLTENNYHTRGFAMSHGNYVTFPIKPLSINIRGPCCLGVNVFSIAYKQRAIRTPTTETCDTSVFLTISCFFATKFDVYFVLMDYFEPIWFSVIDLSPVVRGVDNAKRRVNLFPVDTAVHFVVTYPLDSDSSVGYRYHLLKNWALIQITILFPGFLLLSEEHLN